MVGKIFITRSGYDPELGKHVKDPYLGENPTMGACRPDIRKQLEIGDYIFTVSGKLKNINQFVMGGFSIAEKISVEEASERFPEQRLHTRSDGQLAGNVVVDSDGKQHRLDSHKALTFARRIQNYVVGANPVYLTTPGEISLCRDETLDALQEILERKGASPFAVIGRYGSSLSERQALRIREWLIGIKKAGVA
ncbi:MAG TPA: hypothetical protein VGG02_01330 [Chthoniobacterales bacterium]|jgi:hypothetical protein